jgi:16S rRNA (adenine1518-N6/adenine1519-N6)-dimethyltransferase
MALSRPLKKGLGQHLLKDRNLLGKMVRLSGISPDDTVAEIGPGHGDFTRVLAARAGRVYAIELDEHFRDILIHVETDYPNTKVVFSDILKVRFRDFVGDRDLIVAGNIPYNITGEILFKILEEKEIIRGAYLTMQREVAERLASRTHAKSYGALSVIFQLYADVKLLLIIKPGLFVPPPKVESAFISLVFKESSPIDQGLVDFIKTCFRYKRKYLRNSLVGPYPIGAVDALYRAMSFPETVRAEEIEPERFVAMYEFLRRRRDHE